MHKLDKSFTMVVKATDTIDNVKTKIEDKKAIPQEEFNLVYHAKFLVDGWAKLAVFGITKEKKDPVIFMVCHKLSKYNFIVVLFL